ncbi:MAG TPA: ATP-binding protein [Streptosporangiaceae bacterium]|nr:ATP-binding protein [Streptosporangiaceae bacterium]
MATVEVTFTPLPAHVRTARLVATAVARRSGVPESLLDEVRLAVGEACSRAVEAHRLHCPGEPVRIALTGQAGRFEIEVINAGTAASVQGASGQGRSAGDNAFAPAGFSLAVIAGLADDVQISETSGGTSVKMSWPSSGSIAAGTSA